MKFMERLAMQLVAEGRITINTARMMLGYVPIDEGKMRIYPLPDNIEYRQGDPPPGYSARDRRDHG